MLAAAGVYSYAFAFLSYLLLSVLMLLTWRGRTLPSLLLVAGVTSAVWSGVLLARAHSADLAWGFVNLAELARYGLWCLLLVHLLSHQPQSGDSRPIRWLHRYLFIFAFAVFALLFNVSIPIWVVLALFALLLLSQLYNTSGTKQRWATKHLAAGLTAVFAYDVFIFSSAILFDRIDPLLWAGRGLVNALAVPLVAISLARNPAWGMKLYVSRQIIFYSSFLVGVSLYLIFIAASAEFIRLLGGDWGELLKIGYWTVSMLLLTMILLSVTVRSRVRVFLSKHFFSFKYDYREEWGAFTHALSEQHTEIPKRALKAIATLIQSPAGILWAHKDDGHFEMLARHNMETSGNWSAEQRTHLLQFFNETEWLIDLDEWRTAPQNYQGLQLPRWLAEWDEAWLLLPLLIDGNNFGFILLQRQDVPSPLNWEDRDLLKVAAQQAAAHLAQYEAAQALVKARQFEAFNRLSAYVAHDLKNILAQQSLIVSNAEKHKHNPEFVDDMISTVGHSVKRMHRLMDQMRTGLRGGQRRPVDITQLLKDVVDGQQHLLPQPSLTISENRFTVHADREQLATVFAHILQNAQEATTDTGVVSVELTSTDSQVIVTIADTGCGMDEEFLRDRLFQPFDSTKGLTGMGVGAFESRQFIRELGGDIAVGSTPEQGSTFRIVLPCEASAAEDRM